MESTKSGKKDNSKRRYPGVGGRRHNPANIELRRKEAKERQGVWSALSPKAQLAALDSRLGKGVGAKAQRARLQDLIDNPSKPTRKAREASKDATPVQVTEAPETVTGGRLKAKDRRAEERSKRPGADSRQT